MERERRRGVTDHSYLGQRGRMAQSLLGQLTKLRSHWATEYKADCHLLHTGPSSMTPTPRLEIPQLLVSKVTSSHLLPKSRCL